VNAVHYIVHTVHKKLKETCISQKVKQIFITGDVGILTWRTRGVSPTCGAINPALQSSSQVYDYQRASHNCASLDNSSHSHILTPSDCCLFRNLKSHLDGVHYPDSKLIRALVEAWLEGQTQKCGRKVPQIRWSLWWLCWKTDCNSHYGQLFLWFSRTTFWTILVDEL